MARCRLAICKAAEDVMPVLTSRSSDRTANLFEARSVVGAAIASFKNESARILYCEWHGIDYEKTIKYAETLIAFDKSFHNEVAPPPLPPQEIMIKSTKKLKNRPMRPVARGQTIIYKHNVRIAGMSEADYAKIVKDGRCPLCRLKAHDIVDCPLLLDELRPFG